MTPLSHGSFHKNDSLLFWTSLPAPSTSYIPTLFHEGNKESRLGPLQSWVSRGHTHPWMQWAAVTTQLRSMRAPPHTCSFPTRRLTSQGQWRDRSKFFGHQGWPQASGTVCQGDTVVTQRRLRMTKTKMPPGEFAQGCKLRDFLPFQTRGN